MSNPDRLGERAFVRELPYTVATAVGIGELAIGVARHKADDQTHIIFEIAEVTELGTGRYATSIEADELRAQNPGHTGILKGTPEMFTAFITGIQANEFDGILPEASTSQENLAS